MKNRIKFLGLFLLVGIMITAGCKDDEPEVVQPIPATINVLLDGTAWKTTNIVSATAGSDFTFLATKGDESLLITLPAIAVDTFLIDGTTSTAARYSLNIADPIKTFYAGSGSIEITEINGNQFQAVFNLNTKNANNQKKIFTDGHMVNIELP